MKEILLFYRNENNEPIELPLIPRIEVIIKEFPKKIFSSELQSYL